MGNQFLEPRHTVKFYLLSSLPDAHPIVVERGCHAIDFAPII
jgi:hypothetical protein